MKRHLKGFGASLAVAAAIGVTAGLYFGTQPASAELHTRVVDSFGKLHTLDAKIAQETLAARHGLSPSYDPLTASARQFSQALSELGHELAGLGQQQPDVASALAELNQQGLSRGTAVEQFKTQNSELKTSLYYLPLAARQLSDAIDGAPAPSAGAGADGPTPAEAISELVQLALTQNLLGGREETARVEAQLAVVASLEPQIPAQARDRFRLLIAHTQAVLRTQQLVDPIVRNDLLGSPVKATLTDLEQRYGRQFEATLENASWYRNVLYTWSTLLLAAVIGIALKLRGLYAGLERLVAERTHKLDRALKEVWGEMELAKKIQTALVPRQLSLRDCDVAAVMRPAQQVGGDYYDVFEIEGTEWVLIGDVSGHGVPAGLVMMMCQTAVRSVVTSRPDIAPDELLATVNRTLTQNIELLGEDKYMTISALRCDPDGTFRFAGMHQDLLIYRAKSGRLEQVLAQGTWLDIAPNIRGLNPVRSLKLSPGDALVLNTDGITEATRDGEMLDIGGLTQALLTRGSDSAEAILAGILDTLASYEVRDDVAAIIVKQLEPQRLAKVTAA